MAKADIDKYDFFTDSDFVSNPFPLFAALRNESPASRIAA
jgi:hypothetical protein